MSELDVMQEKYSEHDRIPMQYLIIDAIQDPDHEHEEAFGGATVGCWIRNQTKRNSYLISKGWIEAQGWKVRALDEQYPVSDETYQNKPEGREYFEQALIDDEVFVFFTFPNETKA